MDKNEFLAVEVMQFEPSKQENDKVFYIGNRKHNGMWSDDWNPFENIKQAMMLLEKISIETPYINSLQGAICEVVLQARGYYESTELLDEKNT